MTCEVTMLGMNCVYTLQVFSKRRVWELPKNIAFWVVKLGLESTRLAVDRSDSLLLGMAFHPLR